MAIDISIGAAGVKETALNRALRSRTNPTVLSRVTALPGSPTDGDIYIVPHAAGAHPDEIAYRSEGAWLYVTPEEGWNAYVLDDHEDVQFDGSVWVSVAGGGDMLAATYDPTNVAGDAFDQDNMVDGTTNKNFTATEQTKLAGIEASADVTDAGNVGSTIHGATGKATPVDNDELGLIDSAASNVLKKLLWSDTKATLKTYFDTLYAATGGTFTAASTTEVLTGTDSAKGVTSDALAALWEKGADVASSGTTSLGEGGYFHVTGTTTITDIDWATAKDGRVAWVIFDGILTLTHHATTFKLPSGANITTAAGDRACFVQDASDNVICLAYFRADGSALLSTTLRSNVTANLTAGYTATAYNLGTQTTGTTTPDPANGNFQRAVNGGAHTLAPPSVGGGDSVSMTIQYTNNGSAGTITTSGFTKVTGSALTTVNGDDFMFFISVCNGFSLLNVVALQ